MNGAAAVNAHRLSFSNEHSVCTWTHLLTHTRTHACTHPPFPYYTHTFYILPHTHTRSHASTSPHTTHIHTHTCSHASTFHMLHTYTHAHTHLPHTATHTSPTLHTHTHSVHNVVHKYLEQNGQYNFKTIYSQRMGKLVFFPFPHC